MISTKGRYALRIMLDLADHPDEGYIPLKDIAARQDISKKYLDEFLAFIQPDAIREGLKEQRVISFRYMIERDGIESYEMIRFAGVRHPEDRDDHIVHAVSACFSDVDSETRKSLAQTQALGEALAAAQEAMRKGRNIYTDVEMVRTGINKKKLAVFGGEVKCLIADDKVAAMAKAEGITRSMAAMRTFGKELDGSIVAIGNAPTALFEVLRMVEEENILPAAIVGIPVGFVGAADSKELLAKNTKVPYITVEGTKGGSPIAAAAINAMLYLL